MCRTSVFTDQLLNQFPINSIWNNEKTCCECIGYTLAVSSFIPQWKQEADDIRYILNCHLLYGIYDTKEELEATIRKEV